MTREEYDEAIKTRELVEEASNTLLKVLERYEENPKSFLECISSEDVLYSVGNNDTLEGAKYVLGNLSSQLGFQIRMTNTINMK